MAWRVVFEDVWFDCDVARASPRGKEIARGARADFEQNGIESDQLLECMEHGPDGTSLFGCVKTYLGPGTGRGPGHWGMVFVKVEGADGDEELLFLAFGVRHQPVQGTAPTVYWLADRRLHDKN